MIRRNLSSPFHFAENSDAKYLTQTHISIDSVAAAGFRIEHNIRMRMHSGITKRSAAAFLYISNRRPGGRLFWVKAKFLGDMRNYIRLCSRLRMTTATTTRRTTFSSNPSSFKSAEFRPIVVMSIKPLDSTTQNPCVERKYTVPSARNIAMGLRTGLGVVFCVVFGGCVAPKVHIARTVRKRVCA